MRFPLKFALSAVLANTIAAELSHSAQNQQLQNEFDAKLQHQQQIIPQAAFRQAVQTVSKLEKSCSFLHFFHFHKNID